jgi:hypothetical protein
MTKNYGGKSNQNRVSACGAQDTLPRETNNFDNTIAPMPAITTVRSRAAVGLAIRESPRNQLGDSRALR